MPKGMIVDRFWSKIGCRFSNLGPKSGKGLYTLLKRGLKLGMFSSRLNFFMLFKSEIGWGKSLILI